MSINIVETIKAHPLAIGGGVIVLLLLMRSGGSSNNAGNTAASMIGASLQSQQIASTTNVALAQVNGAVSKANGEYASANYQAGINAAADVSKTNTGAMIAAFTAMLSSNNNSEAIASNRTLGLAQINAAQLVALDSNSTQLKGLNAQITGRQTMTDTLVAADKDKTASIFKFEQANLPSLLQHAENMAKIGGSTAVDLARVNGQTQTALAQTNTSAARTAAEAGATRSDVGALGNLASTVASLFAMF